MSDADATRRDAPKQSGDEDGERCYREEKSANEAFWLVGHRLRERHAVRPCHVACGSSASDGLANAWPKPNVASLPPARPTSIWTKLALAVGHRNDVSCNERADRQQAGDRHDDVWVDAEGAIALALRRASAWKKFTRPHDVVHSRRAELSSLQVGEPISG